MSTLCFFYCFLLGMTVSGQDIMVIEEMEFRGIEKLNLEFLYKLIDTEVGDTLNLATLDADETQLRRLTAVATTKREIIPINQHPNKVKLVIEITERRTWFPIFGIGGIQGNFFFLAGLSQYNLAGKNQTLSGQFLLNDGLPNGQIFYQNQRINGGKWGFSAEIKRSASQEPLFFEEATVEYQYTNLGVGLNGIYSFRPNRFLSGGFQLFQENYLKLGPGPISELPGPDEFQPLKWLTNVRYKQDEIRYDYFYQTGYKLSASLQWVITFGQSGYFTSLILEGNKYWRPSKKGNIATRVRFGISNNDTSPFVAFVLDSQFNLRGVGNRVDRGTAQVVINLEYRHTAFEFGSWSSQLVLFSDIGSWRDPGGRLKDLTNPTQFRHFAGGGIRIINKEFFLATLRIDYGVDLYDSSQRGFVLGMGQYF